MHCPKCGEPFDIFHRFCSHCGSPVKCEDPEKYGYFTVDIEKAIQEGKLNPVTEAEHSRFVLRGLINYHDRVTMGRHSDLDFWKKGLEFALACVEEKIEK